MLSVPPADTAVNRFAPPEIATNPFSAIAQEHIRELLQGDPDETEYDRLDRLIRLRRFIPELENERRRDRCRPIVPRPVAIVVRRLVQPPHHAATVYGEDAADVAA